MSSSEAKASVDEHYKKVAKPGYSLEYCGLTAVDLHGTILQAALNAAEKKLSGRD